MVELSLSLKTKREGNVVTSFEVVKVTWMFPVLTGDGLSTVTVAVGTALVISTGSKLNVNFVPGEVHSQHFLMNACYHIKIASLERGTFRRCFQCAP